MCDDELVVLVHNGQFRSSNANIFALVFSVQLLSTL